MVLGGQPARRVLSPEQTARMIEFAARSPNLNAQSIEGTGLQVMETTATGQLSTIVCMQNTQVIQSANCIRREDLDCK